MANVELKVKSGLKTILADLESLKTKAEEVTKALEETGDETSKSIKKNTKETETFFGSLRTFGRRVSDQLKRDFKSLVSVESLGAGLKISSQFKDSISETVQLSDAIRKLGPVFGMAERDFVSLQKTITDGLGEIGLSSEVATRTLQGLSQTQVRGASNITSYSKAAGQLASVTREQGREGDIAKGLASVIQARGGDVNDKSQMEALAESLRRVFLTTGQGPTQALQNMEEIFSGMAQDLRKTISPKGLASLAAIQAAGGPNATKFLKDYLGESPIMRTRFEAQGGKGIFTDEGLDIEKFRKFAQSIISRVGGDPRFAAKTLGIEADDAAEGFVRLVEALDRVTETTNKMRMLQGDLNKSQRESMGLGEAFRANINRIKKAFSEPLATATQGGTDLLSGASKSDAGAAAVVAGGGLLAALLTGGGLRGVGKGLLGTAAKSAAAEEITGQKTVPVYVTNASEIAIGSAAGGIGGGMGLLGKAGAVGLAGFGGAAIGQAIEPTVSKLLTEHTTETTKEGFKGDVIERLFFKLDMLLGGDTTSGFRMKRPDVNIKIQSNAPMLKDAKIKHSIGNSN